MAFGSLYTDVKLHPIIEGENLEFDSMGPAVGAALDITANSITLLTAGVYEITANVTVRLSPGNESVIFGIYNGDNFISGSRFQASVGKITTVTLTIGKIVQSHVSEGDVISIRAIESNGCPEYLESSLTVKCIL
ncbi:hypothetical protein [Metabacillus rhizolycopersici]|uniref:BclA C-terminal domain-containing protein n=1 Tax=Metabacillus rhizolycopersici TaxID=2875709 RepID=A0ABS7UM86_9BACI|nr:hypothetical protein [Metabacillus rhizolycopersici]MBZ5749159.1 hypothetical protein [Metabacillus rhizolycopersici]